MATLILPTPTAPNYRSSTHNQQQQIQQNTTRETTAAATEIMGETLLRIEGQATTTTKTAKPKKRRRKEEEETAHLGNPSSITCFPRPFTLSTAATSNSKIILSGTNFPPSMNLRGRVVRGCRQGMKEQRLFVSAALDASWRTKCRRLAFCRTRPPQKKPKSLV